MQELLANTIKHAGAKNVTISINKKGNDIAIQYKDDGNGSDITSKTAKGMGMHNIESRLNMIGAQYEIETASGKGFIVNIMLPQSSLSKTTLYE
jgi:signal transduction histidine kinase